MRLKVRLEVSQIRSPLSLINASSWEILIYLQSNSVILNQIKSFILSFNRFSFTSNKGVFLYLSDHIVRERSKMIDMVDDHYKATLQHTILFILIHIAWRFKTESNLWEFFIKWRISFHHLRYWTGFLMINKTVSKIQAIYLGQDSLNYVGFSSSVTFFPSWISFWVFSLYLENVNDAFHIIFY